MLTIVLYIRGIYCPVTAAGLQQQEFGFINGESCCCCCIRWWHNFYGGPTRICASESDFTHFLYSFLSLFLIRVRRNESLKGNVHLLCCLAGSLYSIVGLYWIEYKVVHWIKILKHYSDNSFFFFGKFWNTPYNYLDLLTF